MKKSEKKRAEITGIRIGLLLSGSVIFFIIVTYFLLSQNFQKLLTDYTIQMVQTMVEQGVTIIEYELQVNQKKISELAEAFPAPDNAEEVVFSKSYLQSDILRMIYVTEKGSSASDGRRRDLRKRQDIIRAFEGETAVYGPYFNEEKEYVVCYSAPVRRNGETVGVLSIEKDGYYFSRLIENIRFGDSGESYIIDAQGTDIAVSNQEHISWVNEQYNAGRLLQKQNDLETRSVMELEEKGLSGQRGNGTFYWSGSLCYVAYAPISSVGWVLLTGVREEEISAMTQTAFYTSMIKGPTLGICAVIFFLLVTVILFWVVSSMKKSAEMNEKLNIIANYDSLTGVMNRNRYHTVLDTLSCQNIHSLACIYIDVNGLHEINNHLGHQAGDTMLIAVAETLRKAFEQHEVYRIGGDEFVIICRNIEESYCRLQMEWVHQELKAQNYEISIGIAWQDQDLNMKAMVNLAEEAMQQDKQRYYQADGKERQMRWLDQQREQMAVEKQDADTFLSVLAPEFKGVYFVDLGMDTIRHLYIPAYFEEMLKKSNDSFSKALQLYTQSIVAPDYQQQFQNYCNYSYVEEQLSGRTSLEYTYQKTDGTWMKLRILKFKTYAPLCRETLWIFSNTDGQA